MEYIILDDIFGLKLWNENIFRRVYHHFSNNNYTKNKIPLLYNFTNLLTDEQIKYLQTTNFDSDNQTPALNTNKISILLKTNYSPRSTLYFDNMDRHIQIKLEEIGNSLIPLFNKILNTKLRLADTNFRTSILRYEGAYAQFGFHYDTEHKDCFRALILYDGQSIIPPFCYINTDEKLEKIHLKINDGIIFRGTTTYHGVEPSKDPNTKRYLVGFQYIKIDSDQYEKPSLTNKLRGASLIKIIQTFIPYGIYYNIIGYFDKISIFYIIDYRIQLLIDIYLIYCGLKYSTKMLIGKQIPNTLHSISLFYIFCYIITFNHILALNIITYIIISEMFVY